VASGAAPLRAQDAKPTEPTFVVRLKSIDGLIADTKYIAGLVGQAEQADQAEKILQGMAGPKGLAGTGIDTRRPIGLYSIVTPAGVDSYAALLVPVADESAFVEFANDMLGRAGAKAEKGEDGVYTVTGIPAPVPIYFTFAERYAYVTAQNKEALDAARRQSPAKVLAGDDTTLAAVTLRIDQIPDMIKQIALGQIEVQMAAAKDRKEPNETPAQAQFKGQTVDYVAQQVKSLLTDGQTLELKVGIDRKTDDFSAQLNLTAKPNTPLAKEIAGMANRTSPYAGIRGLAMQMGVNVAVPEKLRGALAAVIDEGFQRELSKKADAAEKEIARKVFGVLGPVVKAGRLELFAGLRGPDANGHYTAGAVLRVPDGKAIEQLVRDLLPQVPPQEREQIKLDAEKVGDTSVHRVDVGKTMDAEGKRIFGDNAALLVAFPREAVVVTLGGEAAGATRALLGASGTQPALPFVIEASVARLAGLDKNAGPEARKVATEVFGLDPQGKDLLRLSVEGGQGLRVRFGMKGHAIRFGAQMHEKVGGAKEKPE
jgi:hypothetical protein